MPVEEIKEKKAALLSDIHNFLAGCLYCVNFSDIRNWITAGSLNSQSVLLGWIFIMLKNYLLLLSFKSFSSTISRSSFIWGTKPGSLATRPRKCGYWAFCLGFGRGVNRLLERRFEKGKGQIHLCISSSGLPEELWLGNTKPNQFYVQQFTRKLHSFGTLEHLNFHLLWSEHLIKPGDTIACSSCL